MRAAGRDIYYYDTVADFEAEKFAGRLLLLLMEELRNRIFMHRDGPIDGRQPGAFDRI